MHAILGSLSLKEKIQIVLNQKGNFKCPNSEVTSKSTPKPKPNPKDKKIKAVDSQFEMVLANLKQRGNSRPRTVKTLSSTIKSLFANGLSEPDLQAIVQQLQTSGKIEISGTKVSYSM